ncbi:MAG TPA: hypothetical protein PLS03_08560 [Terrimicrobiaceae bacterium]|nr:hypothetical protein [Terrimicrobiaceae bacterium]
MNPSLPVWKARTAVVLTTAERLASRYGALILLIFALLYYGQYYRSGLNLSGEGGTNALIAMRLMEGQRPIADTFLGYNVMWFYPIVWLFEITGPDYVALRLFFFAICALGGILGFFVLRRTTGCGTYSVLVAGVIIMIPGMLFRNYMPFLGLLNMFLLLQAFVFSQRTRAARAAWILAAGAGLGLTYLTRVDLGIFMTVVLAGLAVLYPFGCGGKWSERLATGAGGLAAALLIALLVHWPVYADAKARGFAQNFVEQYATWVGMIRAEVENVLPKSLPPAPAPAPMALPAPSPAEPPPAPARDLQPAAPAREIPGKDKTVLQRVALRDAFTLPEFYDRAFALITYLPILAAGLIVPGFGIILLAALIRRDGSRAVPALTVLTAVGCALTLFPQFFFFRPDTPHLSEFMAPFLIALGCAAWHAGRWLAVSSAPLLRIFSAGVVAVSAANASLYVYHSMPKESAGTIAAAKKKGAELIAQNGVRVFLKGPERDALQGLADLIASRTDPADYIVCYPYAPTINFMTNRRSYESNLYVDNATAPERFHEETLAEIAKYRPAAIIIDNRKINKAESSQFSAWAAETYAHIRQTYRHAGTFGRQEVYLRPDKAGP